MGKSGAIRSKPLDASSLAAMQNHELRLDDSGKRRRVRDIDPLVYSPHGENLTLEESYHAHVEGAHRNAAAKKLCLHAFVQFPTDIEITPQSEQVLLDEAVTFINKHHGGNAVFRARLDRDEVGRHGVDVFYAPRYLKVTKRKSEEWISLTKFGKQNARDRLGKRQDKDKTNGTPLWNKDGSPKEVWNDSMYFQGRVLQDFWYEYLRDEIGLDWVVRGKRKVGRDPDRLEVEEYKLKQDTQAAEIHVQEMLEDVERRELEGVIKAEVLSELRVLLAKATLAIHNDKLRPAKTQGEWAFEDQGLEAELSANPSVWDVLKELLELLYQQFLKVKQYLDDAQRRLLRDDLASDISPAPSPRTTRGFKP